MISGIRDVQIALGIQANRTRIITAIRCAANAPNYFNEISVRVENLNPAVAKFAHEFVTGPIDAHIVGITHLATGSAGFPVLANEFAVSRKNLNTMIAGIGDKQP